MLRGITHNLVRKDHTNVKLINFMTLVTMKNKIAIVVAYFGKFPNYFSLWVKSCAFNPTIDFFVFTDQKLDNLPVNVKCIAMTIQEMRDRASVVLGFKASLSRPYKCCDYKPLYGLIFKDYLSSYDYWGHCDVDLIFGDLQTFLDRYNLYDYDKFGALGHLSLYKNTDEVNNAFKLANNRMDYRVVFTTERNMIFDELSGITAIMKDAGFSVFSKRIFIDISTLYHRFRIIDVYPLDLPPRNYNYQTFCWERGKTYHTYFNDNGVDKEECLYVHFQKRPNYIATPDVLTSDSFLITNKGFISGFANNLSKKDFHRYNPYYGVIYERVECQINYFSRRVRNLASRLRREYE